MNDQKRLVIGGFRSLLLMLKAVPWVQEVNPSWAKKTAEHYNHPEKGCGFSSR